MKGSDGGMVDATVDMGDVKLRMGGAEPENKLQVQAPAEPEVKNSSDYQYQKTQKPPFVNAVVYYRTIMLFKRLDAGKSGFITVDEYLENFIEAYEDEIRDIKQIEWIKEQVLIHCQRSSSHYVNVELVLNLLNEILRWSETQKDKVKNWRFRRTKAGADAKGKDLYEDEAWWRRAIHGCGQWSLGKRPGCCGWDFSNIENKQGASVASYFKFAEKLFFYNLWTSVLLLVIMVPGIYTYDFSHPSDDPLYANNTYEGLFLGNGLEHSFIFYSDFYRTYYGSFNMSIAWAAVVGFVLLLSLRNIVHMGHSHRADVEEEEDARLKVASVVFSFFDFSMASEKAMAGQIDGLETTLIEAVIEKKDTVAAEQERDVLTTGYARHVRRVAGFLLTVMLIGGTCTIVAIMIAFEDETIKPWLVRQSPSAAQYGGLIVPAVVSFFRIITPFMIFYIVKMEKYHSAEEHFKHYFGRLFLLRVFFVMVILFQTLIRTNSDDTVDGYMCKETAVGVFYYSLIIVDTMIDSIGVSLIGAKARALVKRGLGWKAKGDFVKAEDEYLNEFPIALNLINIMYMQALIWCGMVFSPALPLLGSASIAFQIFVKRYQVLHLCRPPHRPMGVAKQKQYFQRLFVISLLVAVIPFTYFLHHPVACGPFLEAGPGKSSIPIDVINAYVEGLPTVVGIIANYIRNVLLLWIVITVLGLYNVYATKHHQSIKAELKYLRARVRMETNELKAIIKKEKIVLDEAQETGKTLFSQWMHQDDMLRFSKKYFNLFAVHYFDDLVELLKLTEIEAEEMLAEWTYVSDGNLHHMEPDHVQWFLLKMREKQAELI